MSTNITEFSRNVQPHVMGCPSLLVDAAVVDSIIKLCEETHCWEKGFEHDVLSTDINTVDNDSVSVDIATYITNVRPLVVTEFKIDGSTFNTAYIEPLNVLDDISDISIQGAVLFTYSDLTHIKFYDIEAKAQRFWIKQAYAPVATITTVEDLFYAQHNDAIVGRALWKLMRMPKKDWTDPVAAQEWLKDYTNGVALAGVRKNMSTGSTRVKSMRFF